MGQKYFIDTEFVEGKQDKTLFGFKYGETKPTIDLISIALVSEDNREYYAISKDFNLKEAWNRWQPRQGCGDYNNINPREYWLRENVLKPIFEDLVKLELITTANKMYQERCWEYNINEHKEKLDFTFGCLKYLFNKYGKTNKQIAEEVNDFVNGIGLDISIGYGDKEFYGYFSDYDWVVFCQLFGTMNELPNGFPYYLIDLKQEIDSWIKDKGRLEVKSKGFDYALKRIKDRTDYPKQTNEHNALADARWTKQLYHFLDTL